MENTINDDREFLDRNDIFDSMQEDVFKYIDTPDFYMLYAFYGMGGIGKSKLVEQIYNQYHGGPISSYMIPLEILNHQTIPAILLHIRHLFSRTPHFDYVLFRYWDFINYDITDREKLYNIIEKAAVTLADGFDHIISKERPSLKKALNTLIGLYEERDIDYFEKNRVTGLLHGKIEDLYKYMTQTLAEDLQRALQSDKYLFIFDAYNTNADPTKYDWLFYFVNTFQRGMFIVTSREKIKWFSDNDANQSMYKNIPLESIPGEVVEVYLLEQGYSPDQISVIKEKTDCIPIFLDIVLKSNTIDTINKSTFVGFKNKSDIVKWFLNHLDINEQSIIEYLSVVKLFNEEIYDNVLCFNRLSCLQFSFADFKQSTIIRYVEEFNGLFKIHSVLAYNIAFLMDTDLRNRIIVDYIQMVWARILNNDLLYDDVKYNLITNIYTLVNDERLLLDEKLSEQLIDMYFYLCDKSYEHDFATYISKISRKKADSLIYIYSYILGRTVRLSCINKGLKQLEEIPLNKCGFGKHKKTLQCDINYLLSISGKYNTAGAKMQKFVEDLRENERGQRYYTNGIIYNCDMKMLKGCFKSAVSGLLELENSVSDSRTLFEIHKAIGHNYRFNFLMVSAMEHYTKCDIPEKKAYYYTVFCETNCYLNPNLVFNIYKDAKEENEKYNNNNNLGKIYYAMAISNIIDKEYTSAKKYIEKSKNKFNKTQYRAGMVFVMISQAFLTYAQTKNIPSKRVKAISNYIQSIDNIYEYLLLPIYVAQQNEVKIEEYRNKFEWFSYDETIKNIEAFIARLRI